MNAPPAIHTDQTVYYLGPQGTFTHAATLRAFQSGARFEPIADIPGVFEALARDEHAFGVVPIENSIEGSVSFTLEALTEGGAPNIVGEIIVEVEQCLLGVGELAGVREVLSHPHALAQCKHWLRQNLPRAKLTSSGSTAGAAFTVRGRPEAAAIASALAAQQAGIPIIARGISDRRDNATRFLILGRATPSATGRDKTSIVFGAPHRRGALYRLLGIFDHHDINLSRIESRPMPGHMWQYIFFADLEGHRDDMSLNAALQQLQANAPMLRVLGSYPRAPALNEDASEDAP